MEKKDNKIFNPVRNEFLSGANGVKNIILKSFKFISSRFVYLTVGIFLAVSIEVILSLSQISAKIRV